VFIWGQGWFLKPGSETLKPTPEGGFGTSKVEEDRKLTGAP